MRAVIALLTQKVDILCEPHAISGKPPHFPFVPQRVAAGVQHGNIAGVGDRVHIGDRIVGHGGRREIFGAILSEDFKIIGNGIADPVFIRLQHLDDKRCLLQHLRFIYGGGEEIDAHLHAGIQRPFDVLFEVGILIDLAGVHSTVAAADHGKLDACRLDLFPVDFLLVTGNVHADDVL